MSNNSSDSQPVLILGLSDINYLSFVTFIQCKNPNMYSIVNNSKLDLACRM